MDQKWKRRIAKSIAAFAIAYCIGGIVLYFIQDFLLFHPRPLPKDHPFAFNQPFTECNFTIHDHNLSVLKFRSHSKRKGIVLFFHGNRENVEHYRKYPALFTQNGYETWMTDYPGFGKTTGERSEAILYSDALFLYNKARKELDADSIVIYGKSIGTGIAAYTASKRDCKRLILETPYYSIEALAKHYFPIYPVLPMTKYSFPIYRYLKELKAGVAIFHGTRDEIIPYRQALQLKRENRNVELITIENGKHNNLIDFRLYQTKLDSLLRE